MTESFEQLMSLWKILFLFCTLKSLLSNRLDSLVTNLMNLCKHTHNETNIKDEATILYQFEILLFS